MIEKQRNNNMIINKDTINNKDMLNSNKDMINNHKDMINIYKY